MWLKELVALSMLVTVSLAAIHKRPFRSIKAPIGNIAFVCVCTCTSVCVCSFDVCMCGVYMCVHAHASELQAPQLWFTKYTHLQRLLKIMTLWFQPLHTRIATR